MPKVGLLIIPFWNPHFGWTPRLNYTVVPWSGIRGRGPLKLKAIQPLDVQKRRKTDNAPQ